MDIKELYKLYQQHQCITTDSRDCPEGSIFLALKGESFNGNKFAMQALEKGCSYAIVDEDVANDPRIIKVDDCLQTFKDLAREHRRQFDIPVIGITGTNGKTTTKELIAAVLSKKFNVLYTQGNFNNDVGVPKTLFRLNILATSRHWPRLPSLHVDLSPTWVAHTFRASVLSKALSRPKVNCTISCVAAKIVLSSSMLTMNI